MKEGGGSRINPAHELRHAAAAKMWNILLRRLNLGFSEESRENLMKANQLLKKNSIVLYANHTSMMNDAQLAISMVFNFLTNAKRVIGPVAMKHYDLTRDLPTAILLRLVKMLGIGIMPIVQSEDIDKNASMYSDDIKQKMSAELRTKTEEIIKLPGSVYGIAPEGTSRKGKELSCAKKGIGYLYEYDPDGLLYYLPVAIVYKEYSDHPEIIVGEPLRLKDMGIEKNKLSNDPKIRAQFLADSHMRRLAGILPMDMRGYYQ